MVHFVSEHESKDARVLNEGHFASFAQNWLPWQHPFRNRNNWPTLTTFTQYLPFVEKLVKIGLLDPEIALLSLKKKKQSEGKIYSPVG